MKSKNKIIAIGELLWDIFPDNHRMPGGAPANFVYHACQQGKKGIIVSMIGIDAYGDELRDLLAEKKIDTSYVYSTAKYPTGTVLIELDKGKPSYQITENTAWDNIVFRDELASLALKADVIYFGSLACRSAVSRDSIFKFLEMAPKECMKIFDINLRQNYYDRDLIEKSFLIANLVKLNDEELLTVAKIFDLQGKRDDNIFYLINEFNLESLILTMGKKGALYYSDNTIYHGPVPESCKVVSTVGCGDAFLSTLTSSIIDGYPPQYALEQAEKIATFVATQSGAMPDYSLCKSKG